jgi:cytochrome c oxidase cbb3-type subunit IV
MKYGLNYFTDTHLTVIGLLIFFSYFAFMLLQVFKSSSEHIAHLENIPFNNKENI